MMKKSAVIENADGGDQGGADQNTGNLGASRSLKHEQDGNHDTSIDGQSPEKGNGSVMHLSGAGQIHHPHAQRKRADRNDQHHGSKESDEESEQACGHATSFHMENKFRPGLLGTITSVIL